MSDINKREFFRFSLITPICAEMSIVEHNGKKLTIPRVRTCINDISAGGLSFTSKLVFPTNNTTVFEFYLVLFNTKFRLPSNILWKIKLKENVYKYGVSFNISPEGAQQLIILINRLDMNARRGSSNKENAVFCSEKSYPCDYEALKKEREEKENPKKLNYFVKKD